MLKFRLIGILCICIAFILCSTHSTHSSEFRDLTETEQQLVACGNRFGLKLFREIVNDDEEHDKNIFISPLSVAMNLAMVYNGAAGSTEDAMQQTLELTEMTIDEVNEAYCGLIDVLPEIDSKVDFRIANSIWYRQDRGLEQEFLNICATYFKAMVSGLDFNDPASVDIINDWVSENTNGKITEIIDSINPLDVMFLINAIYFKGDWTYKFDKDETEDDYFTLPDGSQKQCKMMKQEGAFQYFETNELQAIDLPYGDEYFRMTIFLPMPEKHIDSVIADFSEENWELWLGSFQEEELRLQLPKFTIEYGKDLEDILAALGMGIAFTESADFTNMRASGGLSISKVKHKTYIQVDEEGTEAAAATSTTMTESGPPLMRVDRPFFFVIWDNHSQVILFIGKIVEPTLE